jgi:predicted PurR-regulated permease PerM
MLTTEGEIRERTVPALLVAGGVAVPLAEAACSRAPPRADMSRGDIALLMLAAMATVAALHVASAFFIPLTVGVLLSYSLRPVVDWFAVRHIPRALTAAVVLTALVAGLGWSTMSLRDDATAIVDKLPEAARKLRHALNADRSARPGALARVGEAAKELERAAAEATTGQSNSVAAPAQPALTSALRDYAVTRTPTLATFVVQALTVLLLAYFLLASGGAFRRNLLRVVGPSMRHRKITQEILDEIDAQIQRFMLLTVAANALIGITTWLAFWALGVMHAGVWGVASGVLHFVPYIGPALIATTAGVAGVVQSGSFAFGLAVAGVALVIAGTIGALFVTWMQSRISSMSTAAVFIALLFFGWLWGVWGLLLGAPLAAIGKVISDRVDALRPVGTLLERN